MGADCGRAREAARDRTTQSIVLTKNTRCITRLVFFFCDHLCGILPTAMRDTIDIYESFIQRALQATFKSPFLVVLGVLVAAVNTGSVLFHLYQFATILAPLDRASIDVVQALPLVAWLGASNLFANNSFAAIAVTVLGSVVLFLLGVSAQQYLIQQSHKTGLPARRKSRALFSLNSVWLHLVFINALYFLGLLLLFMGGGAFLSSIPETYAFVYSLGTVALYATLIVLAFCWNVLILLSLMHVVQEGSSVHEALQESFAHIVKNPLSVFELSLIQLVVELLFAAIFALILGAGGLLAALLVTLLSATGSPLVLQTGFIFIGATVALGLLLFAGLVTSFGYHLWSIYHNEQHSLKIKPVLHHLSLGLKSLFVRT